MKTSTPLMYLNFFFQVQHQKEARWNSWEWWVKGSRGRNEGLSSEAAGIFVLILMGKLGESMGWLMASQRHCCAQVMEKNRMKSKAVWEDGHVIKD